MHPPGNMESRPGKKKAGAINLNIFGSEKMNSGKKLETP